MGWATLGVIPQFGGVWPDVEITRQFRGRELLLLPESETGASTVSTRYPARDQLDAALGILRRFLSAATWASHCGFEECVAHGGSSPGGVRRPREQWPYKQPRHPRRSGFDYVPEPTERSTLLALGLFREAVNERNPFYKFLGFFKIVETVASGGPKIKQKIGGHLSEALSRSAPRLERASYLTEIGQKELSELLWTQRSAELPAFLYKQGRCAIAHAHGKPLRDPDESSDLFQIQLLLPLIETVARVVIERDHGVGQPGTR